MALLAIRFITLIGIANVAIPLVLSDDISFESVKKICDEKLDFKSIAAFKSFMNDYRQLHDKDYVLEASEQNKSLKKCLDDKESLIALEKLVENYDRSRPCKLTEVAKLERYAETHFINKRRPLSLKFYTLFGVNIGFVCQLNLLAHINQADTEVDQVDFIYSMASPIGWNVLINEYTKKSMKFGSSSNAGGSLINRIAKLIPGLVNVNQLKYMNFKRIAEKTTDNSWNGVETFTYESRNKELAKKIHECLNKIVLSCQKLDQLYVNLLLSLAKLNDLGLLVSFEMLSTQQDHSLMLHKWLAATSFCQLMARVSADKIVANDKAIKLEIVHEDNLLENRRKLYSYVAEFEDIRPEALEGAWQASVPEASRIESPNTAVKQLEHFIKGLERDLINLQSL